MIATGLRKINRPQVKRCVFRSRLEKQLESASALPVIAVLAPPGYGKTSFVSRHIESTQRTSIWYSVDEGDTDLAQFCHHFSHAITITTPKTCETIPNYQNENSLNIKAFSRRYFSAVYQRLGQSFYLVFDDIHQCQSPQWSDFISVAVEILPLGCQIFLISRQTLPPAFSRLAINQQIHVVNEKDLRFSDDELLELAATHDIDSLSTEQCHKLQTMMSGWGAGLTLLFSQIKDLDKEVTLEFNTKQELFNYFMNEVFRHIDDDARNVLYHTCFLPDISIEHATALSNNETAGSIICDLHKRNYFTYRITNNGDVYRYHPLFRSFLIAQSKATLSVQSLADIQMKSIKLLEQDGALITAAGLFIDAADWTGLAQFTIKYSKKLITTNRIHTLMSWLQHLPPSAVENNGWLLFWRGTCLLIKAPTQARQDFLKALDHFKHNTDIAGQCLSIANIIYSYMIERNDFSELDPWINQVDQLHAVFDQHLPPEVTAMLATSMFSALAHRAPHHPKTEYWLDRISHLPPKILPPALLLRNQVSIVLHYLWQGDFHHAEVHHSILEKQLQQTEEPSGKIIWHIIHTCFLWCAKGDSLSALQVAKKGLDHAKEYELPLWNISLLTHAAASALISLDIEEAGKLLRACTPYIDDAGNAHKSLYHELHTVYSYNKGEVAQASYHAQQAIQHALSSGVPFHKASVHLMQAQLNLLVGNIEHAKNSIATSKDIATTIHSKYLLFNILLCEATILWSLDQRQASLVNLRDALQLARKNNLLPSFWISYTSMTRLLVEAMRLNIEAPTARYIIEKRALKPTKPPYDIENWPWLIRIQTLNRFEILIKDKPLTTSARQRPKLFALLKVLIAFGGENVREELICEAVWPDSDGDAAHQSFDTTLFRLRKVLGVDQALINRDGMLSLNRKICWLDIWALNEGTNKLKKIIYDKKDSLQISSRFKQLQSYYQGDFLTSENFPIITQQRKQIQLKWVRLLHRMAEHYIQSNNIEGAEACLEKLIEHQPLEEKSYRILMSLYISKQQFSSAAAVYDNCKKAITEGLGVQLSKETELVFDKIRK